MRQRPKIITCLHAGRWPEHHGDVNDVTYDADGACEGQYGCVGGPRRANMGSRECVVMGLK